MDEADAEAVAAEEEAEGALPAVFARGRFLVDGAIDPLDEEVPPDDEIIARYSIFISSTRWRIKKISGW